jgi:Tat protein translocase TatB subunit
MPSLSPLELLVVGVIALIVFGPEKLPEIARSIGRTAANLRRMAAEVREDFDVGLAEDEDDDDLFDRPAPTADRTRDSSEGGPPPREDPTGVRRAPDDEA